jgi:hypothetical protein
MALRPHLSMRLLLSVLQRRHKQGATRQCSEYGRLTVAAQLLSSYYHIGHVAYFARYHFNRRLCCRRRKMQYNECR